MKKSRAKRWHPTKIVKIIDNDISTSTSPVIVLTEKGKGYFKAVENNEGANALARKFVGTALASWFGLSTFAYCLFEFDGQSEMTLNNGKHVNQGTGFMTKKESGSNWDKTTAMLDKIINKDDITRLVCFDTWVRNPDRHCVHKGKPHTNSTNVFLATAPEKKLILKAMDFTHAFPGCIDNTMDNVKNVYDVTIYGLFAEFVNFLKKDIAVVACAKLRRVKDQNVRQHIEAIPQSWNIDAETREAWIRFIVKRANFVANNFLRLSKLDNSHLSFEEN